MEKHKSFRGNHYIILLFFKEQEIHIHRGNDKDLIKEQKKKKGNRGSELVCLGKFTLLSRRTPRAYVSRLKKKRGSRSAFDRIERKRKIESELFCKKKRKKKS